MLLATCFHPVRVITSTLLLIMITAYGSYVNIHLFLLMCFILWTRNVYNIDQLNDYKHNTNKLRAISLSRNKFKVKLTIAIVFQLKLRENYQEYVKKFSACSGSGLLNSSGCVRATKIANRILFYLLFRVFPCPTKVSHSLCMDRN